MSRRRPRVEGVLFDCYGTLIDILTDEHDIRTYRCLSRWLLYQGVRITPRNLRAGYLRRVQEAADRTGERYPEVRVEGVFARHLRRTQRMGDRCRSTRRRGRPGVPGRIPPASRCYQEEPEPA